MRVNREKAAENRERIVEAAARLFREHGFDGGGVDAIMKEAGLTHGGFYGHFASKEELATEAITRAFAQGSEKLGHCSDLGGLVNAYLSDPPAEREIADGERSQIDHRPGEGEAAHDEAKPRDTGDPGASGDCLVTVQSQRDRANPHLPFDPTEGFRGCAMIKSAANPGRALPGNLACRG